MSDSPEKLFDKVAAFQKLGCSFADRPVSGLSFRQFAAPPRDAQNAGGMLKVLAETWHEYMERPNSSK